MVRRRSRPALLAVSLIACAARADVFELGDGGTLLTRAADAPPTAAVQAAGTVPPAHRLALAHAAARHGLSPALLEALVWQESRWHSDARSPRGAIGLTQLMPQTAQELGVDPHDPAANLEGGARYLRRQLDRFEHLPLALAAYNAGPAAVEAAHGIPELRETRAFIDGVLDRLARIQP